MRGATRGLAIGAATLLVAVGVFAASPSLVDDAEYSLLDWRFRLRGPRAPASPVAVIAIDARSIDELGRWPWRRDLMAELVERLAAAGAAAIGLDVVFSEPEQPPEVAPLRSALARLERDGEAAAVLKRALAEADTDARLERALRGADRVVLGYFFRTGAGEGEAEGASALPLDEALRIVRGSRVAVARLAGSSPPRLLTCTAVEPNLERFHEAARRSGFFSAVPDPDGVVRQAALVARCGGALHLSLGLALAEVYTGERAAVLGDAGGIRGLRLGPVELASDASGRILIDYRGPPGTFPTHSAVDVLRGRVAQDALRDRVVLIGTTEVGLRDTRTTPFGTAFPGVEIHANVVDNLLSGSVLRHDHESVAVDLALLLGVGLLICAVVPRLPRVWHGAAFAAGVAALLVGAVVYAFVVHGLWIQLAYPAVTLAAVYLAIALWQSMTSEAQSRMIRSRFEHYVPREVVAEMIRRPESFRLGGERRDVSLLFSDIREFTTLSEDLGPESVAELLRAYLNPMTRIVFETGGTLDKYIGDAVVAFWGAPLPVPDLPERAAGAAIAMVEALERLKRERRDLPGAERLRIGVGVHVASVVVGNLGSDLLFDYTVTGDGVNLCSRLEDLTKSYRVQVLASGDLVDRLPPDFLTRELDRVRVKGKRRSVRVCELLGRRPPGPAEAGWLAAHARGLRHWREGDWARARAELAEAHALRPGGDGPSQLLLERVESLRGVPPPDWDGVWTFETK